MRPRLLLELYHDVLPARDAAAHSTTTWQPATGLLHQLWYTGADRALQDVTDEPGVGTAAREQQQ